MTLILGHVEGAEPIADIFKRNTLAGQVCVLPDEDLEEGEKALTKIRLNVEDESFFPHINDFFATNQTQRIYISGSTGTGKTTFLAQYIINFHKKYPKAKILFFSSKTQDTIIDKLKFVERVKINEDILVNPFTLEEITKNKKPVLTCFDDIQDFSSKKINKEVERLLNEILRNGRSFGVYCIYTHHQPNDYKETRNLIFEASHCVIYPKRSAKGTYDYFLEKKLNINKKNRDLINNLKSNFVCIKKDIPQAVIADKYILLL